MTVEWFKKVKWILTIFNLIFLIFGFILVAAGIGLKLYPLQSITSKYGPILTGYLSYFIIALGIIAILISLIGITGVILRNTYLLYIFLGIILIIFLIMFSNVIVVAFFDSKVKRLSAEGFKDSLVSYYGRNASYTKEINRFNEMLKCCGVRDSSALTSYENTHWKTTAGGSKVPSSCCIKNGIEYINKTECMNGNLKFVYSKGCADTLINLASRIILIFGIALLVFIVLVISGVIFLLIGIRKKWTESVDVNEKLNPLTKIILHPPIESIWKVAETLSPIKNNKKTANKKASQEVADEIIDDIMDKIVKDFVHETVPENKQKSGKISATNDDNDDDDDNDDNDESTN